MPAWRRAERKGVCEDDVAKTIGDYKKDYEAAKAAGDAAGMKAANDGANAIRASLGQQAQVASEDIAKVAAKSGSSPASSPTNTAASGFGGSATGVNTYTQDQQSIKDQMNANSQAWHTADDATKKQLEQANKDLAAQLGGSVSFNPGSGTWSGSAQQQQQTQQNFVNDYSQYIQDMNQAQREAALAELRAAYEKNLAGLDRTQKSIAPTYQAARNQAAGNAALQQQAFNEYAAANGLSSGTGGQAQLAFRNSLQGSLSDIDTAEASSLADLELQRNQAEIDYNNAIAQAEAQGNYELAQQLYQEKVRVDEALREQMMWQAQQEFQQQQFDWQKGQQSWQNDFASQQYQDSRKETNWNQMYAIAQALAQYGDFSGYQALGIDTTQMEEAYRLAQQPTVKASGGGSRSETGGKSMTLTTAKAMAEAGQFTDEVLKTLRDAGFNDAYLESVYGYGAQAGGLSEAALSLKAQLESPALDRTDLFGDQAKETPQTNRKNLIERAVSSGRITEKEAMALLDYFGL